MKLPAGQSLSIDTPNCDLVVIVEDNGCVKVYVCRPGVEEYHQEFTIGEDDD